MSIRNVAPFDQNDLIFKQKIWKKHLNRRIHYIIRKNVIIIIFLYTLENAKGKLLTNVKNK